MAKRDKEAQVDWLKELKKLRRHLGGSIATIAIEVVDVPGPLYSEFKQAARRSGLQCVEKPLPIGYTATVIKHDGKNLGMAITVTTSDDFPDKFNYRHG